MFALFDYSSALGLPTDKLIMLAVLFLFLGSGCVYFIFYRDREAQRLLSLDKQWGKTFENDEKELKTIKFRLVALYSAFLVLSLLGIARTCFELLRRF